MTPSHRTSQPKQEDRQFAKLFRDCTKLSADELDERILAIQRESVMRSLTDAQWRAVDRMRNCSAAKRRESLAAASSSDPATVICGGAQQPTSLQSQVIKLPLKQVMRCTACGAKAEAACDCGVPYVPAGQLAAAAVAANPEKSDRAIAAEIGVNQSTVSRARQKTTDANASVVRTGRDGKRRKMPGPKPDRADTVTNAEEANVAAREAKAKALQDVATGSQSELARLTVYVDEIRSEKRRLEIQNIGLLSENEELKAAVTQVEFHPGINKCWQELNINYVEKIIEIGRELAAAKEEHGVSLREMAKELPFDWATASQLILIGQRVSHCEKQDARRLYVEELQKLPKPERVSELKKLIEEVDLAIADIADPPTDASVPDIPEFLLRAPCQNGGGTR